MPKCGVFLIQFPVFRLNMEIYELNLGIHFKYGKIQTRRNSVFGQIFSQSKFHKKNQVEREERSCF